MKSKSFCEDLTEGKFSFPIIHAVRARADDTRLLNILKQRTEDVHIKRHAVDFMRSAGSFEYTRKVLGELRDDVEREIGRLGGHARLSALVTELDRQIRADGEGHAAPPESAAPLPPPPPGALVDAKRADSI